MSMLAFEPDWVSPPSETIADALAERRMSTAEFAERLGLPLERVLDLIEGSSPITLEIARRLHGSLGGSVAFWMARDYRFRENASRLLDEDGHWLARLPLRDMARQGWIPPRSSPQANLASCLRFFGVSSVAQWRNNYDQLRAAVAFKTSPSLDSKPEAVAAWLRRGEIQATATETRPWNEKGFRDSLADIRDLTTDNHPDRFLPAIKSICASHGVAFELVHAPTGCRASGAARFLDESKAMLLLSYRHRTFDHFWFSFFHEAAHLILHDRSRLFLDGMGSEVAAIEREADSFAEDILLPGDAREALEGVAKSAKAVVSFARSIGVAPGIVVGQMQHRGLVPHGWLNRLKRRFERPE